MLLAPVTAVNLYGASISAEKFPDRLSNTFFMVGIQAVMTARLYDIWSHTLGETASQVKSLFSYRNSVFRRLGMVVMGHLGVDERYMLAAFE